MQDIYNIQEDGEYCLDVGGSNSAGARIYCSGMNTTSPKEYLCLPSGADENYSHTGSPHVVTKGLVKFHKIGLNLTEMHINSWDWSYADTSAVHFVDVPVQDSSYPSYGLATSCYGDGHARIDLRLTGFSIPDHVDFMLGGWQPWITIIIRSTQYVSLSCGGNCGGCVPQDTNIQGAYTYDSPAGAGLDPSRLGSERSD